MVLREFMKKNKKGKEEEEEENNNNNSHTQDIKWGGGNSVKNRRMKLDRGMDVNLVKIHAYIKFSKT